MSDCPCPCRHSRFDRPHCRQWHEDPLTRGHNPGWCDRNRCQPLRVVMHGD